MQVRACQLDADTGTAAARLSAIRWLIADAASDGADVLVLPELALTGYGAGEAIAAGAGPIDGGEAAEIRKLADEYQIAVVIGLALRQADGSLVNAALVARPGKPPIAYAKQHLYETYEKELFVAGSQPAPIFEIAGMKAGVLVCFDVEFPERVRELAEAGAEVVFVPTALPASPAARFIAENLVPVRAFENQIFLVYANHVGTDARFAYQGLSCIAGPDGSRLGAASDDRPALLSVTLDPADFGDSRAQNPYLAELARHPRHRA